MAHTTQRTPVSAWASTAVSASVVLPVWRSPTISSRWPRPMGNSASTTFTPVCSGVRTASRATIGVAGRSTGQRRDVRKGGPPSSGRPSGSTTRPSRASPTGTSSTRPVRATSVPAPTPASELSSTTPDVIAPQVEGHALLAAGEAHHLVGAHPRQPAHGGDAAADRRHHAQLVDRELRNATGPRRRRDARPRRAGRRRAGASSFAHGASASAAGPAVQARCSAST
jgi:hypothetical protein